MEDTQQVNIERLTSGKREVVDDVVISEVPLTLMVNNKEMVTILCSPSHPDFLAVGYLASEGLISSKKDLKQVKVDRRRNTVRIDTFKDVSIDRKLAYKRVLTTGCARGASFYSFADIKQGMKVISEKKIAASSIYKLVNEFQHRSEIFKSTGGAHSAALCNNENILLFSEDIGRHNAIDKIFGECLLNEIELKDSIVITSGRIASEILLKVVKRDISIIVSRSAPTDLAIRLANQTNITLVGFVRGQRMNIYTNSWRITGDDA